jgi:hypothetical protein
MLDFNSKYKHVKIPKPLANEILQVAIKKGGIYRSVTQFVVEATSVHLQLLENNMEAKEKGLEIISK